MWDKQSCISRLLNLRAPARLQLRNSNQHQTESQVQDAALVCCSQWSSQRSCWSPVQPAWGVLPWVCLDCPLLSCQLKVPSWNSKIQRNFMISSLTNKFSARLVDCMMGNLCWDIKSTGVHHNNNEGIAFCILQKHTHSHTHTYISVNILTGLLCRFSPD